jgi:[acyl-carrier-protein] S-malonyltransferase
MTWLSAVAGLDLVHYGTEADADTIRDTAVAQPLLVASGLLVALELFPHPADAFDQIGAVAGHSVGELAAAAGARAITAEQAMVLVRERGRAMAAAAQETATSMTAVLGGDRDEVLASIEKHGLTAANDNGPGQIVAAGTVEQLAAFADDAPSKARLMPLSVAGAFHTQHMSPAVDVLGGLARSVSTHDARIPLISNRDGQIVHDGREVLRRIVTQISSPVRWDLCMDTMLDLGVTGMLEMPPAGTLTGIARRAMKGVETFALKTPDQLDDARSFIAKHGGASHLDTNPTWRMLVAPTKGTFHQAADLHEGSAIQPDARIGAVQSRQDETAVTAPYGGTIVEWLVEDGDLVSPGQPLIRLHPEGVNA